MVLRYHSPSIRNLYAAMMVHDTGHSIAFHIDAMNETLDYEAASREGIWWLPNETTNDFLVLTNQGQNTLDIVLSLYDATGREMKQNMSLAPQTTSRYSVRQLILRGGLSGKYGGIKVYAPEHGGSLDTLHAVYDETRGFSALLKMFDHDPKAEVAPRDYSHSGVWTLRAPMLALTDPDPALGFPAGTQLRSQLFIRNTTDKPVNASLYFNWHNDVGRGKVRGPTLLLKPQETRNIVVSSPDDSIANLPQDAHWASVTLSTSSRPDEVVAIAASYDDTLRYGAQTPFSDQLTFKWEGGKWEYDGMHDSIITAGNGGTTPTKAGFTIFYDQGKKRYDLEQTLQPDEQMWIDVGKLIREHTPDENGHILPDDLNSGSYEFRDLTDPAVGSLFEGKVIYDKTYGHVSYGCAACCAYTSDWLTFNPLGVPLSATSNQFVSARDNCGDTNVNVSYGFGNGWSVANTAIATVSGSGVHAGMSIGNTSTTASGSIEMITGRYCTLQHEIPVGPTSTGKKVQLISSDCFTKDAKNNTPYFAGWADPNHLTTCGMTVQIDTFPPTPAGSCISNPGGPSGGTKNCWQVNTTNSQGKSCTVTTCATNYRTMNSDCSAFIDSMAQAEVTTTVCSQ
jgi:hypothetical protein